MAHVLGQNQYGKAETRVVRVTRQGERHSLRDLNVSVALSGDLDDVHLTGSNANCLPTDTAKNTVYAFAKQHGVTAPETFAAQLARHFVADTAPVRRARIRVEEYAWHRVGEGGHSFVRDGSEVRTAEVVHDGAGLQVVSGLKDLVVMNTTDSEFWGFLKDGYTTLKEAYDRILATEVTARWTYGAEHPRDWDATYAAVRGHLLAAFAETYSYSLQQTLYAMGSRVLDGIPEVTEVRLSLPNKHHFLVDLEPLGLKNDNEVYFAADRPYGLIEGTVLREGASAVIPVD